MRVEELERYDKAPELSEDDDSDEGESPKLDQLIQEDGDSALLSMTYFKVSGFNGWGMESSAGPFIVTLQYWKGQ